MFNGFLALGIIEKCSVLTPVVVALLATRASRGLSSVRRTAVEWSVCAQGFLELSERRKQTIR